MADTTQVKADSETFSPVCLVYSREDLKSLRTELSQYGNVGPMRVVYSEGAETDRTIVLLPHSTYQKLVAHGFAGKKADQGRDNYVFRVVPYRLTEHSYPGEGKTSTLFVPVPSVFGDARYASQVVTDKMDDLVHWGVLPANSFRVRAPIRSRETGAIKGGCFITFDKSVTVDQMAYVRIAITDTYWPVPEDGSEEQKDQVFRCYWAREQRKREDKAAASAEETGEPSEDPELTKKRDQFHRMAKAAGGSSKFQRRAPKAQQPAPKSSGK